MSRSSETRLTRRDFGLNSFFSAALRERPARLASTRAAIHSSGSRPVALARSYSCSA